MQSQSMIYRGSRLAILASIPVLLTACASMDASGPKASAALDAEKGAARAADLRDRIGGGRKVAIHILEFFDRIGYTRRVRDTHILRGSPEQFGS